MAQRYGNGSIKVNAQSQPSSLCLWMRVDIKVSTAVSTVVSQFSPRSFTMALTVYSCPCSAPNLSNAHLANACSWSGDAQTKVRLTSRRHCPDAGWALTRKDDGSVFWRGCGRHHVFPEDTRLHVHVVADFVIGEIAWEKLAPGVWLCAVLWLQSCSCTVLVLKL